jgi:hypothetical protein
MDSRSIVLPAAGGVIAPAAAGGAQWLRRANGTVDFMPIDARLARAALTTPRRSPATPVSRVVSSDE